MRRRFHLAKGEKLEITADKVGGYVDIVDAGFASFRPQYSIISEELAASQKECKRLKRKLRRLRRQTALQS